MSADARGGSPRATRRRVVVTGASAGLGYFVSEQLAATGARVVLACRDEGRAERAAESIRAVVPDADLQIVLTDLADLASTRAAAEQIAADGPVDALVANAGVVGSRRRRVTSDGFELQFGTNHLGHFALVSHLLPAIAAAEAGRIVHVGSIAHRFARLDLDDPMMVRQYRGHLAYSRSKLAVMTFGFELDRRLRESGSTVRSLVAHPGFSLENLTERRPGITRRRWLPSPLIGLMRTVSQGKDQGARPLTYAAIGADVQGGEYWGPDGWFQLTGSPALVRAQRHAHSRKVAARLWNLSSRLTRVHPILE
ncbi:SDR family NAD(P)-dependent oxidoreductase [Frondihabitans australicus]|uniref:NADP-dependent 3-hydroxy acid dehydrogenase YdfG n=1 Tax=Frondihabitans australicus TaxID=386892 RepID=A0A495IFM3_9MICO|nr:SDR family NAD(P)-dependent oxidoreductase [Frondihabitans australicus]RKR74141.1 NADP-dependent 3-hydroxy acid dehydrogenase YdfG [Frondihabitans australicus]